MVTDILTMCRRAIIVPCICLRVPRRVGSVLRLVRGESRIHRQAPSTTLLSCQDHYAPKSAKAIVTAAVRAGIPFQPDFNGGGDAPFGFGTLPKSILNGTRFSASRAFLTPRVRGLPNFSLLTEVMSWPSFRHHEHRDAVATKFTDTNPNPLRTGNCPSPLAGDSDQNSVQHFRSRRGGAVPAQRHDA